jgi:hypothetical protein
VRCQDAREACDEEMLDGSNLFVMDGSRSVSSARRLVKPVELDLAGPKVVRALRRIHT